MPLSNGCNHVTIITSDIDRLIAFYSQIFDAEVTLDLREDGMRHALIDLGGGFCLHPFQFDAPNAHGTALPDHFSRGHIDHFAIDMPDAAAYETARRRLVEAGASAGRIRDFGMVQITTFEDPDGMTVEIGLWKEEAGRTMAESRVEEYAA